MSMVNFDQFSTAKPLLAALPSWIADDLERKRIAAYQLYEQIYWTVPESFKLLQRGQDNAMPIYVPSGRIIVETLNRFLAPGLAVVPDPAFGTPQNQELAVQVWTDLARRERFYSKFASNKRYGIMRGDWAWHFYADPLAPPGSRMSVMEIDPAALFPIYEETNLDNIIGWHVVEQFIDDSGKVRIKRLTYRKTTGTGGPSPITVEDAIYEVDKWGGPGMDVDDEVVIQVLRPPTLLPQPIDDLPIYHIPHFDEPQALWGSSEMRGLERIIAGVNQGISDEELTLAMDGLGLYATDSGSPIDEETGDVIPWNLGPGRVVEVPKDHKFVRVSGVTTVAPFQEHLKYLHSQMDQAVGQSDVTKGKVDVDVAESGISLIIQHGPMLAHAGEKELLITDVLTNMLFNLPKWLVAYEGGAMRPLLDATRWIPIYGPKLPTNTQKEFENVLKMMEASIIPNEVGWGMLRKLGYELPDDATMQAALDAKAAKAAAVEADALASRINGELGGEDGTGESES